MKNQGNIVAGCLLFAFFFYITTKGNLPKYMSFLFGSSTSSAPGTNAASSDDVGGFQGVLNRLNSIANGLLTITPAF